MISEWLCQEVAESLWAMFYNRPNAPHIIWPSKRDSSQRISEQESKILITHWLERNGKFYSIETPTQNVYIQSGNAPMSASIDVTVYSSSNPANREFNVELKAGTASLEAFRKDFEKLLREGITGLWFHTLTNATKATWTTIEIKINQAFDRLEDHVKAATHSIHFAFCVLEWPRLVEFDIDFATDWRTQLSQRFQAALKTARQPDWASSIVQIRPVRPKIKTTRSYNGTQRKALIYAPSIEPNSFIHLSTKGDSYALRAFAGERVQSRFEPDCKTTTDLLASHHIAIDIDVTDVRKSLKSEQKYWADQIRELNIKHGIGQTK